MEPTLGGRRAKHWLVCRHLGPRKKVDGGGIATPTPSNTTNPSKTGELGQELIKEFEGTRLESYYCSSHILTIGTGHTGPDVYEGQKITQAVANQLLRDDLERFEKCIVSMIDVPLTQNQFDSLISWSFNVGAGAVQESTLRRRLNRGEDVNTVISEELPRWCNGPNGPLEGLVKRRAAEVKLAVEGVFP